jgi:glutaredoxin
VKEFLSREGVRFTVKNVDEDDAAYDELIARGLRTIPVTIVGDRLIRGYDPDALKTALAAEIRGAGVSRPPTS